MKIDVSNLVFVCFYDDLCWKENAVVLRNGAGLFSQSNQGPPSSNQSQEKLCGYKNSIPTCLFPRPNDPISPFSSTNKNPCYTQDLPVSIISNLQIKTLVYMKLFCINNYYFQHLH